MEATKDGYINRVFWDTQAKELVLITNSVCALDHTSPEAFKVSHGHGGIGACKFVPLEGIALRVVGVAENGRAIVAWTYRGVDPDKLQEVGATVEVDAAAEIRAATSHRASRYYLGRV